MKNSKLMIEQCRNGYLVIVEFNHHIGVARVFNKTRENVYYSHVVDFWENDVEFSTEEVSSKGFKCRIITEREYCEYVLGLRERVL